MSDRVDCGDVFSVIIGMGNAKQHLLRREEHALAVRPFTGGCRLAGSSAPKLRNSRACTDANVRRSTNDVEVDAGGRGKFGRGRRV